MDFTLQPHPTSPTTPVSRGARVRYVRETLLHYTRRHFGETYDIPAATIRNWEAGKYGGLTEKGASKLVEAFQAEGVPCSVEWLLYELGEQPGRTGRLPIAHSVSSSPLIAQELGLFRELHANAMDAIVADDSMKPALQAGDLVAGERYFGADIRKTIGQYCIIQLLGGEVLIRELNSGNRPDEYILTSIYPKTKTTALKTESFFSVAPIVWIRRKVQPSGS